MTTTSHSDDRARRMFARTSSSVGIRSGQKCPTTRNPQSMYPWISSDDIVNTVPSISKRCISSKLSCWAPYGARKTTFTGPPASRFPHSVRALLARASALMVQQQPATTVSAVVHRSVFFHRRTEFILTSLASCFFKLILKIIPGDFASADVVPISGIQHSCVCSREPL